MILQDYGIFTEESDVEVILDNLKIRLPNSFAKIPKIALERMKQNLLHAIREPATQPLERDPFLTEAWQIYHKSTAPDFPGRTPQNVSTQRRCFYVKANSIGPEFRCSYFDKELSELESMGSVQLQALIEKTERDPTSSFRKYKNANQTATRLPSKARISRLALMYAYKEYRMGGPHPILAMLRKLQDYGLNSTCIAMLIQGFTLDVDVVQSLNGGDIALLDYNGIETGNRYINPDLVEPVFYKIMSDEESQRMYFKAQTHYGKLVEDSAAQLNTLSKIKSAYKDDENQIWLKLKNGNEIVFTEYRNFIKAPRYLDTDFFVRCIPGEASKIVAKRFTRHVVKSSVPIKAIKLVTEGEKEEIAVTILCRHTNKFVNVPLKYLYFPKTAKRARESTETRWQRSLKNIRQESNPLV